jgi:membrane-bound inhibitor of C-type lysozyme
MKSCLTQILMGIGLALYAATAAATDLTLHLLGSDTITPQTVKFQCDAEGTKIGLPSGPFSVHYFNGAGNSLAVVPIGGKSLIFANVMAASGARYASGTYIWWEAGGAATLYLDSLEGKDQSSCHPAKTEHKTD